MRKETPFSFIYDSFLTKVTDDMYMELTELDTYRLLEDLLISAIHWFEFPRVDLNDYEITEITTESIYCGIESNMLDAKILIYDGGFFNSVLTDEEINILSTYMVVIWLGQQLASVENTRMKYSGQD